METQIINLLEKIAHFTPKCSNNNVFHENHFATELSNQIKKRLGGYEGIGISLASSRYERGLNHARKNNLQQAQQAFQEGDKLKNNLKGELDKKLVNVFELPAVSYWYYKNADYEKAEELLWEVMRTDSFLETNGFTILLAHRIQQLHNIARIHFKKNNFDKACDIINQTLRFAMFGEQPDFEGSWDFEQLQKAMTIEHRAIMLWQLASETTLFIHRYHPQEFEKYYQIAFNGLHELKPTSVDEDLHVLWFNLKNLYLQNEYAAFVDGIEAFINQIDANYIIYLYSLTVDLYNIHSELFTNPVDEILIEDIFRNLRLPSYLTIAKPIFA